MTTRPVTLAAEGTLDLAVLRRLARDSGLSTAAEYGKLGKTHIDRRLHAYNNAARHNPWIVLRDLDNDRVCAGALANHLLPAPARLMTFRIAVRTVEAWLLSDHQHFTEAFCVSARSLPTAPEQIDRPKAAMIDAISRSTSRMVREAMLIRLPQGGWSTGPEYNALLEQFARTKWQPRDAATRSPSLAKARLRIQELSKFLRQKP
jgi:hypothetical protein